MHLVLIKIALLVVYGMVEEEVVRKLFLLLHLSFTCLKMLVSLVRMKPIPKFVLWIWKLKRSELVQRILRTQNPFTHFLKRETQFNLHAWILSMCIHCLLMDLVLIHSKRLQWQRKLNMRMLLWMQHGL